jgi:hypothetical protein
MRAGNFPRTDWMEDQFLEKWKHRNRLVVWPAALAATLALTACGGGGFDDNTTLASSSKASAASRASRTLGAKPIDTFGNFNPSIWDDHNWYECNCARNPDISPSASKPGFQTS